MYVIDLKTVSYEVSLPSYKLSLFDVGFKGYEWIKFDQNTISTVAPTIPVEIITRFEIEDPS